MSLTGDPASSMPRRRTAWAPLAAGGSCMAGFLILAVLWFSRGTWAAASAARLPGLFDYPSAYLGDSVLLPVAAALLAAGARSLPAVPRERVIAAVAASAGASALAGLQGLWLLDDHPARNWTLPAPHRFNIAGIWHAAYSVLVAALLAGAAALLARRMSSSLRAGGERREVARKLLSGAGSTGVLSCLFCYSVLAAHDSTASTFGSRSTLVGLGLGFVAFLALTVLVLRHSFGDLWPSALLGILAATAVIAIFEVSWHADRTRILGSAQAVLAAVGVALITLVPRQQDSHGDRADAYRAYREYRPTIGNTALAGAILAALLPALWSLAAAETASSHWFSAAAWIAGYGAAIGVVTTAIVRRDRLAWLAQAADALVVFALFGVIALAAITVPRLHQASDSAPLISFVVAIVISRFLFPVFKIRMMAEIRDERSTARDANGGFGLEGAAKLSATATVGMLITAGLTGAIALIAFTLAAAIDRKYVADSGALHGVWLLLAVGLALVVGTGALAWVKNKAGAPTLAMAAPLTVLAWPTALVMAGAHGVPPETWVALAGGVLLALWSANTMLNNAGLLRGSPIDALHWTTVGAVTISAFISGSFALSAALASGPSHIYTWFAGISTAAAVLGVNGGLSVAAGSLIARTPSGKTRHGLLHNLIQDATLFALLYLIALIIPVVTLLHLPPTLGYWGRIVATFAIVGPFLTYFLGPYQWQLTTNLEHLGREITSRAEDPDETTATIDAETELLPRNKALLQAAAGNMDGPEQQRFLRVLSAHIRNQNLLANSVVVLSLVGLLVLLGGTPRAAFAYLRREMGLDPGPQP